MDRERSSVNAEANPDNTYEDGSVLRSVSASDGPRGVITCHPKMVRTSVDRLTPLPNANIALRQNSASGAPTGARTSIDCSEIVCVGSAVTERKSEIWAYLPQAGLGVCHVPLGWLHAAQWPVFAQVYCLIYDERRGRPRPATRRFGCGVWVIRDARILPRLKREILKFLYHVSLAREDDSHPGSRQVLVRWSARGPFSGTLVRRRSCLRGQKNRCGIED